jgi:putative DNA primase/helicase
LRYSKAKLAKITGRTHKTTAKALSAMTAGDYPFLRVETGLVEVLNPYGGSLAEKFVDADYRFIDVATGKAGSVQQLLTAESYRKYFSQELPDLDPEAVQQDVCCPFHADTRPSMSVNLDSGVWKCHVCDGAEGGLIDFEMHLLDTEDRQVAWTSIAKKFGVKLLPRNPGRQTGQHTYLDAHGESLYQVRRYEDGSARFYTQGITGKWRRGLKGVKRVPYNLQQLAKADVAILTEGEKKADQVQELGLVDAHGNSIAATCTGGATSWRTEFAEHFAKKCVLVLRDSDEPGERYANAVSASLTHACIEHNVIEFEDFGNDVRDYLKDHSATELVEYIGSAWLATRDVPTLEGV